MLYFYSNPFSKINKKSAIFNRAFFISVIKVPQINIYY